MNEATDPDDQPLAVQTDSESQEYGAQHGQDISGRETGSSSPVVEDDDPVVRESVEAGDVSRTDDPGSTG